MGSINILVVFLICFVISTITCQSIATIRFSLAAPALRDKTILLDSNAPLYNITTPDITPYVNTTSGNHTYSLLDEKSSQKLVIQDMELTANSIYTLVGHYAPASELITFTSLVDNWNVPVGSAFVRIVNFAANFAPFDVLVRFVPFYFQISF